MSALRFDVPLSECPPIEACPLCGSAPQIWRYRESETTSSVAITCSNGNAFGPQETLGGITSSGCAFYMPPTEFYRDRIKSAIEYWNSYAKAVSAMRRQNNWKVASVLREANGGEAE